MTTKRLGSNHGIRYSESFKMEAVRELESGDLPYAEIRRKYGIKGSTTVAKWVRKYAQRQPRKGNTSGKARRNKRTKAA